MSKDSNMQITIYLGKEETGSLKTDQSKTQ